MLLALLSLGACGRTREDAASSAHRTKTEARPRPGGTLLVPIAPLKLSLHPLQGRNSFQPEMWDGLHPSLLRLEARGARPPIVRGDLARVWSWSPEEHSLTLRMRHDRVWEDTTRIGARDVAASYDAYLKASLFAAPAPRAGSTGGRRGPELLRVEAVDDSTVRFVLRGDVAEWRGWEIASHPILAASWLEGRNERAGSAVTSGPPPSGAAYRIPQNLTGKNLTLRANPLLPYGVRPWVRRLLLEPCPGADSRVFRVAMGRADYASDVPVFHLASWIGNDATVNARHGEVASVELLVFRDGDATLSPAMREAVTLAIDRERLLSNLLTWRGTRFGGVAAGILEPAGPPLGPAPLAPPPGDAPRDSRTAIDSTAARLDSLLRASPPAGHDVARAKALLDQLGLVDGDGDGLRGRNLFAGGLDSSVVIEAPIKLRVLYDQTNEFRERLLTFIEEDLFAVGLLLEPEPVDAETFFSRYEAGEFQLALIGFRPPPTPDLSALWSSTGRWNGGRYESLSVDALIEEALRTDDPARVEALNREVEATVRRDRPAAFLIYREEVDLVSPRVRGWESTSGDLLGRLEHVWLADTTDLPSLAEMAQRSDSLRGMHR